MKAGCWDLHQTAENGAIARGLMSGELSKAHYAVLVGQMYLFNARLDAALRDHRPTEPLLDAVIDDEQFQSARYEADLADLGVDRGALRATPGTRTAIELVDRTEDTRPADLLALHYVREGANNGNHYVAKKLAHVWGQTGRAGLSHLDPYGKDQRRRWNAFKAQLDGFAMSEDQKRSLVRTGREMFQAVMAIHRDVESDAASKTGAL